MINKSKQDPLLKILFITAVVCALGVNYLHGEGEVILWKFARDGFMVAMADPEAHLPRDIGHHHGPYWSHISGQECGLGGVDCHGYEGIEFGY